jgi:AraC-like DNA-binding protein
VDALAALLDGPRARDAFVLRSVLSPPWALRIQDGTPLTLICPVRGSAWICRDDPVRLDTGDIAIVRGPEPYTVADDPLTTPRVVIHPGQLSTTPSGEPLCETMDLGIRTWGDHPDGSAVLLTGTYEQVGEISGRLLSALPALLRLGSGEWASPLVPVLTAELTRDVPGQQAVLDRLLDLLLVSALREWFARPGTAPGWYRAHGDPMIGPALRLLEDEPAEPWTVASLAARVGASRAAFTRRFTALVGEPPMSYLTSWRLGLAADLLREPDLTLAAIARRVGYASAFGLSAAFKRERGMSPQQYRTA